MKVVRYERDADQIGHLILDRPEASANLMDNHFATSMAEAVSAFCEDSEAVGAVVRSTKKTFFAGGDLKALSQVTDEQAESFFQFVEQIKSALRQLETQGKPVVACLNGAALGGGWEVALACHHRVAVKNGVQLGLPEVTLGLLPGGGGVVRMTRLLGLQGAQPYLLEGKLFKPEQGQKLGLVHAIVDSQEDLLPAAKAFILANPEVQQPYDVKGYKVPGGKPNSPAVAQVLPIAPAVLKQKTKGVLPAPRAILATAVESLQTDFDTACRIETRYFVDLCRGQVAKNMINTFWFQMNQIKAGASRPKGVEPQRCQKLGILGAGMMGAGIAYAAASKGIPVVLKDVSLEAAEKGKSYSTQLLDKRVQRGRLSEDKMAATLALIQPTDAVADLADCDLVIEAVFEARALKAEVTQETEAVIADSAVFASNTSTLPITGLAEASARPQQFIGLHFFSPVDKMPLVEIIVGEKTDDATLARAYDFVQQIGKTPIVVNDSRGFFTSRVFGTFVNEGIAMLAEGVAPASIENAAWLCGFPVGPLAVSDEVSLELLAKVRKQTIADMNAAGQDYIGHPAEQVVDQMLELNRAGKAAGAGFYDYPEGGKKHLWPALAGKFAEPNSDAPLEDIKDRLMYVQAIETIKCLDEKVLTSVRDGNIGSIMGIGFPVWTGGALQFINQTGLEAFVTRAETLAERYGERFQPPASLVALARDGLTLED